mmetsp:Transcript_10939/g.26823  ORF Transcript_10939/g.26823 Transcript_10939/m.26823 type:complete len:256 (+) Transcript_10939:1788-2555(+)
MLRRLCCFFACKPEYHSAKLRCRTDSSAFAIPETKTLSCFLLPTRSLTAHRQAEKQLVFCAAACHFLWILAVQTSVTIVVLASASCSTTSCWAQCVISSSDRLWSKRVCARNLSTRPCKIPHRQSKNARCKSWRTTLRSIAPLRSVSFLPLVASFAAPLAAATALDQAVKALFFTDLWSCPKANRSRSVIARHRFARISVRRTVRCFASTATRFHAPRTAAESRSRSRPDSRVRRFATANLVRTDAAMANLHCAK